MAAGERRRGALPERTFALARRPSDPRRDSNLLSLVSIQGWTFGDIKLLRRDMKILKSELECWFFRAKRAYDCVDQK
jgi:hypothetical protein